MPTTRTRYRSSTRTGRFVLMILLLAATGVSLFVTQLSPGVLAAPSISSYLWGTNLSLYNQQDFFLTSQATVKLAEQIHVQLVRFPYRGNLAATTAAAKQIAAIHATPLLILRYGTDQVATNKTLIQMMKTVFGTQIVYYEYGNEMDLPANGGVQAAAYTASWNTVIPQLKSLAPTGKFIGPSLYQTNPTYIGAFLKQARPRPDAVSWHEYTCSTKDLDSVCLGHIQRWSTHLQQARAAMQTAIGTELPVMITEYNWNPNPAADPRAKNAPFLSAWMSAAIAELIRDQVFAANQYVLTNNAQLAMISDATHTLTAEGQVFASTYTQFVIGRHTPTTTSTPSAATSTVTPTPSPQSLVTATPTESSSPIPTVTPTPMQSGIQTPTVMPTYPTVPTPTVTTSPPALVCVQQGSETSQGSTRWLCVPVASSSNGGGSEQAGGTLCVTLSPQTSQTTSGTGEASTGKTVCISLSEGSSRPTTTPTGTPTGASTSGS